MKKLRMNSATCNWIELIDKNAPFALDDLWAMSEAMVVRSPNQETQHWDDSAGLYIVGAMATTILCGAPHEQNFDTARRLLTDPQGRQIMMNGLSSCGGWDGNAARLAGQLSDFRGDELGSVKTTTNRHMRFMDTPAIGQSMRTTNFNVSKLGTSKRITIYLVPSLQFASVLGPWLRMHLTGFVREIVKKGSGNKNLTDLVLDEIATLKHLPVIEDCLDKYRDNGIRVQAYFQSVGQIPKCFPGQEQTFEANVTQVFFAVNDKETAEYVSARLGDCTVTHDGWSEQGGQSSSYNSSYRDASHGGGSNRGWSNSSTQVGRRRLKPEEVTRLDQDIGLTFVPGMHCVKTRLIKYYREPWLWHGRFRDFMSSLLILFKSALWLAAMIGITWMIFEAKRQD